MSPLTSTIEIDCPPDRVFAAATNPLRFTEWQRDVAGVQMRNDGVFATKRRLGGTLTQQIVHNDPPHDWAVKGIGGPIRAHASIHVDPLDGGARSRVTFTLDFQGHGVGVPLVPLVRRTAAKTAPASYRAFKQLMEEGRR